MDTRELKQFWQGSDVLRRWGGCADGPAAVRHTRPGMRDKECAAVSSISPRVADLSWTGSATACPSPMFPPENILAMRKALAEYGAYV